MSDPLRRFAYNQKDFVGSPRLLRWDFDDELGRFLSGVSVKPPSYHNMLHLAQATARPLEASEFALANEWAVNEGWNPGPHDAQVFHEADPGSLITVEVDQCPVGVISAARMTPDFGYMGFFVLSPKYRQSVHGWRLIHAGFERLENLTIGGDGVLSHLRSYAHFGLLPQYLTVSHQGLAPVQPTRWSFGVERASGTPLGELAAYDAAGFGVPRTAFLREWLALPHSRALVFKREGRVCGLGVARRCHQGVRIGPLQADDPEAAEALFDALVGLAPGEPISIDCPETNPEAGKLARRKGLIAGSATARLYRGTPPVTVPSQVYGLMSFALG